jgi:hypothetical protein
VNKKAFTIQKMTAKASTGTVVFLFFYQENEISA